MGKGHLISPLVLGGSSWLTGDLFSFPGNANGTDHWRGGLSWVGERGPELVNLPRGSQVVPNHRIGAAPSGGGFTYAPKIDARGASESKLQELQAQMRQDAQQFNGKVREAIRHGNNGRML